MGRIVHTWELGGGSGHLSGFIPIATKLQTQGHEVLLVTKDLAKAESLLKESGVEYLQAPLHLTATQKTQSSVSYAEILLTAGFDNEQALMARVKAWKKIFELTRPDLLILDYSPTALLTAHIMQLPRILFGSGFFTPPRLSPLPNYRDWLNVPCSRLETAEKQVLKVINGVLNRFGCSPFNILADLFQADENILCTFKELDHYHATREHDTHYWGPRFNPSEGVIPQWLPGDEKKIFAYLHPFYPNLPQLLKNLRSLPHSTLIYYPGVSPQIVKKISSANLCFVEQPVPINHLAEQCDLVICHAGHGMVSGALLSGLPLLLLPNHAEQLIMAMNAAKSNAAIYTLPESKNINYRKMVKTLLTDPSYGRAAQAFAKKHADFDIHQRNRTIVARCEEIMAGS